MIPFRFGPSDLRLYGAFHPAESASPRLGVLLCNPFGQEAIRIHRFYRVLADRLARVGIASLRFDYVGTGESDGDDMDGNLTRWRDDILLAHAELKQRCGCPRTAWVGARLGGTLAAMACRSDMGQAQGSADALVLWEPIIDGPAYLKSLAQDHVQAISSIYRPPVPPAGDVPRGEALGFGMSAQLIQDIQQLHGQHLVHSTAQRITVVAKPDDASVTQWVGSLQQSGKPVKLLPLSVPFDWTSEEALNTALVPPAALQLLSKTLEGIAA